MTVLAEAFLGLRPRRVSDCLPPSFLRRPQRLQTGTGSDRLAAPLFREDLTALVKAMALVA